MAGVPKPVTIQQFNDLIGAPIINENGRITGHLGITPAQKESRPFVKLYQDGSNTELARNRQIAATELRVYLALLDRLDYRNELAITQASLARDLDIHPPEISRAMKRLESLGVITRGPKRGTTYTYTLSKAFANKGDAIKS